MMKELLKFKDLPRMTESPDRYFNVGFEAIQNWIKREREAKLELNPWFQRGHVWTEEQQVKYIEFLLSRGTTGKDVYFNNPGWGGTDVKNGYSAFVCVDGLQRLTAITRYYNNEIMAFGQYYDDFDEIDKRWIESYCDLIFHVNNLKTEKEVLKWYLEFNHAGTPHEKEELDYLMEKYNSM